MCGSGEAAQEAASQIPQVETWGYPIIGFPLRGSNISCVIWDCFTFDKPAALYGIPAAAASAQ